MKKYFEIFALLALLIFSAFTEATTAYYQPTPYPLKKMDGTDMQQDLNIVHIHDGWLNSYYPALKTFQRNESLRTGGWGDLYRTYFKMDVDGLPANAVQAAIWFMPYPVGGAPIDVNFYLITGAWETGITWDTQPTATYMGWNPAPIANQWWGIDITPWYNNWKNGSSPNYGMRLDPRTTPSNNWSEFRSSRYKDFVNDPDADGKRPVLELTFFPPAGMPDFKLPLIGGASWLLTGEAGGYECLGETPWPDTTHQGDNYFSLDFSPSNTGSYAGDIPILAAASGTVMVNGVGGNNKNDSRGYYITLDHGGSFLTRYIHLKQLAARKDGTLLKEGDSVLQGDQIGIMGTTGKYWDAVSHKWRPTSTGIHLHMNFWYNDNSVFKGGKDVDLLTRTTMESLLLKSYQTECELNTNGVPTKRIRYYLSTNIPTGN
jgi:murein DD-endopeptidase MepM/ murein hydrolase activator NlpD